MSADLHPDSAVPWDLLARHLAGEATPAERDRLRAWVAAKPERLGLLTDATRAWERAGAPVVPGLFTAADVDAAWQRFKPLMRANAGGAPADAAPAPEAPPRGPAKIIPLQPVAAARPAGTWLRIAAALALLVGSVYAFRAVREQLAPAAQLVRVAAGASKRQLTLPDGSRVWLNRNSSLSYAAEFSTGRREVSLQGEAFFEVHKNPERPFTVLTAASRTRVLGTSFNVRAYAAEDSVEVAVLTGRVALAARTARADSLVLLPGTRGVVRRSAPAGADAQPTPALHQTTTEDANFRAWQTDQLVFDNAPVRHVLRTLRATYGTRVAVPDTNLLKCRFTGSFRQPEPAQVLAVLSVATNATLRGTDKAGYELTGPGCP